jgi:hypothetical protein
MGINFQENKHVLVKAFCCQASSMLGLAMTKPWYARLGSVPSPGHVGSDADQTHRQLALVVCQVSRILSLIMCQAPSLLGLALARPKRNWA